MSTTRRPASADPDAVAQRLAAASFVTIVPRADGDAIAAAGVLARVLGERTVPFQISPARTRPARQARLDGSDDDLTVAVGPLDGADVALDAADGALSLTAAEVAVELGGIEAPELALSGAAAAGIDPAQAASLLELAQPRGLEQRAGVAVPTQDLVDGLTHSTLFHAPFSGDENATRDTLESLGVDPGAPTEADHRAVASLSAIDGTDTDGQQRAATTIHRAIRPYGAPQAPFETIGGYADVLESVARREPGTAVALALGGDLQAVALDEWRSDALDVHEHLRSASTGRYDGAVALRLDADGGPAHEQRPAPVEGAARLYRDAATVEPVVVAIGRRRIGVATVEGTDVREPTVAARNAVDGTADWSARTGYVEAAEPIDDRTVTKAVLEAV